MGSLKGANGEALPGCSRINRVLRFLPDRDRKAAILSPNLRRSPRLWVQGLGRLPSSPQRVRFAQKRLHPFNPVEAQELDHGRTILSLRKRLGAELMSTASVTVTEPLPGSETFAPEATLQVSEPALVAKGVHARAARSSVASMT